MCVFIIPSFIKCRKIYTQHVYNLKWSRECTTHDIHRVHCAGLSDAHRISKYVVPCGSIFLGKWSSTFAEVADSKIMPNQPALCTPDINIYIKELNSNCVLEDICNLPSNSWNLATSSSEQTFRIYADCSQLHYQVRFRCVETEYCDGFFTCAEGAFMKHQFSLSAWQGIRQWDNSCFTCLGSISGSVTSHPSQH